MNIFHQKKRKNLLGEKKGKRCYPGFSGPQGSPGLQGPTGPQPSFSNFYGQFLRIEDQGTSLGGNINFDFPEYEKGILLSEEQPIGSFIQVENSGLYSVSYNVKFANLSELDYIVTVQLSYNFIVVDAIQATLFGKSEDSQYSITNVSKTRFFELAENSQLRLNYRVPSSDVYIMGEREANPGSIISVTRIA